MQSIHNSRTARLSILFRQTLMSNNEIYVQLATIVKIQNFHSEIKRTPFDCMAHTRTHARCTHVYKLARTDIHARMCIIILFLYYTHACTHAQIYKCPKGDHKISCIFVQIHLYFRTLIILFILKMGCPLKMYY